MDGTTIALMVGAGVIISFTLGFLFGIGYQSAEDRRTFRKIKKDYEEVIDKIKSDYESMSKKNFDEAYALGKKHKDQEAEFEILMKNPSKLLPWNDIKFGDE